MVRKTPVAVSTADLLQVPFGHYVIKRANTRDEREQIHRLNFETFVREIPQHHADPAAERLVDKFDDKNLYFIVRRKDTVIAMLAVHDQAPFSVADRLDDPATLAALGDRLLEVRLLAVRPRFRHSRVVLALLWALYRYAEAADYSHLLISGVKERLPLYERFGFRPLGDGKRSGAAWFVPMALPVNALTRPMQRAAGRWERFIGLEPLGFDNEPVSLLPGPAQISAAVGRALGSPPRSHRDEAFEDCYARVRATLANLARVTTPPALFPGGGTLANDAIATHLAAVANPGRGLVLTNGAFGDRLSDHARRAGLVFDELRWDWGDAWDLDTVARYCADRQPAWIWAVHCETSTGVLNDLPRLKHIAQAAQTRLCVDCVSSLGSVPLDLNGVYLASAASGKCLGAHAGIALVFAGAATLEHVRNVPSAMDIAAAIKQREPRHTLAWGLLASLAAALEGYATPARATAQYAQYTARGTHVRRALRALNIAPLAADRCASPAVTTFRPPCTSPAEFALLCRALGYAVNAGSSSLSRRGLAQIATMGAVTHDDVDGFFAQLGRWLDRLSDQRKAYPDRAIH